MQDAQSCRHSSPSTVGSTLGKSAPSLAVEKPCSLFLSPNAPRVDFEELGVSFDALRWTKPRIPDAIFQAAKNGQESAPPKSFNTDYVCSWDYR